MMYFVSFAIKKISIVVVCICKTTLSQNVPSYKCEPNIAEKLEYMQMAIF